MLLVLLMISMTFEISHATDYIEQIINRYSITPFENPFNEYGIREGKDLSSTYTFLKLGRNVDIWRYMTVKNDVPLNKLWTITLSRDFIIDEIDGIVIEKDNEFIPVSISLLEGNKMTVKPVKSYARDSKYTLKIFLNNLNRYSMDFYTVKEGEADMDDFETIYWESEVDIYDGVIDLANIGLRETDLLGFDILKDNKRVDIDYVINGAKISFKNELHLGTSYELRVLTSVGNYKIKFVTGDLPEIYETGDRIVVKVPAMPEKGFNWPYYLALPSNNYKYENQHSRRYLMVDTTNTGEPKDLKATERWVREALENIGYASVGYAEKLWAPMLMPVFPRTSIYYYYEEANMFYEHAFDRDIATLHNKVKNPVIRNILEPLYEEKGFSLDDFLRLDEQLVAMFDHATEYLNKYGHNIEVDRMFLSGYSASGTFTDRFATLQPHKVKAVTSGGTLDDMVLPLDQYKNENLIFPIGTFDYKDITGRDFDLSKHNDIARLIYMGKNDTNNTLPYGDCYGDTERNIISKLWGEPVLPRAQALTQLYGQSGGRGIFILDNEIGHSMSRDMREYILEFYKANRDQDNPIYPIPKNTQQLEYIIHQ